MKPEDYINALIGAISATKQVTEGRDRQVIPLGNHTNKICFILHEGSVALYRADNNLLLAHLHAPFIIGINLLLEQNFDVCLQAKGTIQFEITTQHHCYEVIEKENLWKNVAYLFMYYTKNYTVSYFSSVGLTSYELVCNNLQELMKCSTELRLRTNACDYIHEKTMLSKSGIMKTLADLKKGEYIDIQRGILISINKLPKNY